MPLKCYISVFHGTDTESTSSKVYIQPLEYLFFNIFASKYLDEVQALISSVLRQNLSGSEELVATTVSITAVQQCKDGVEILSSARWG